MNPLLQKNRFAGYRQPAHLVDEWRRQGLQTDAVVGPALVSAMQQSGHRIAVVDGEQRLTFADLLVRSQRLAAGFLASGVRPGSVVSWQVPNWWEALVVALATWQVGAVNNPVLMIYREHELRQILAEMAPQVIVAP